MKTDLFDYPLPERLIAQTPAQRRDDSRLLVVHRDTHRIEHRHFRDLGAYFRAGDTLFRNNAAVIPARLHALRPTGGSVECLLLRPSPQGHGAPSADCGTPGTAAGTDLPSTEPGPPRSAPSAQPSAFPRHPSSFIHHPSNDWWCLLRPGKKLPVGATFEQPGAFKATVRERTADGLFRVSFETAPGEDLLAVAERRGEMPLPPYIAGRADDASRQLDRERYQTVYADRAHPVAAAAPTAGLHFTPELLAQLESAGLRFADLTLHVGLGTFRPIDTEHVEDHPIHREIYEIPPATQGALLAPAGRRVAVGTTAVRSIEDFLEKRADHGRVGDGTLHLAEAGIFIYPPRMFQGVDALITNFHQPRSTLLCLVAAFLAPGSVEGIAWLKEIYAEAISREYRFFSYGDAMLVL